MTLAAHLQEQTDLWAHLAKSEKPLLLYGMGNGAEKIIAELKRSANREISGVFASDEFVRGQSFLGHKVMNYATAKEQFADFIVLVAFGTEDYQVLRRITEIAAERELYAPCVPLFGEELFDAAFLQAHLPELEQIWQQLADEKSKADFAAFIDYCISGKVSYLPTEWCGDDWSVLNFPAETVFFDLGAYDGDTVRRFIELAENGYERIVAVEPDPRNYRKLEHNTGGIKNIRLENKAIWSEATELSFDDKAGRNSCLKDGGRKTVEAISIDELCEKLNITPSLIKFDLEGAEAAAIKGMQKTLKHRPQLIMPVYHKSEDCFALPQAVLAEQPEYQLFFRLRPYIPAWDCNFFFK